MTAPEFRPWPKVPRLNRDIVITEKVDGTNAAIHITESGTYAQSRTRLITPEDDNFGFARWVLDHEAEVREALGPGLHFGEWYGKGIQRGYGLDERRLALFNVERYEAVDFAALGLPNVGTVARLYTGPFDTIAIQRTLAQLEVSGSNYGSGRPEGIVVFHTAGNQMFKVTLDNDEQPKGAVRG